MVNNLQQAFEKSTRKYFEQNSSDEEVDLEYPDLKTNVFREKNQNAKNITPKIKEIIGSKAMAAKLSSSGKKLIDNVEPATVPKSEKIPKAKESADNEKAIEKRGRKRKQKFKDKHKSKGSKSGKRNNVDDDDEDDDVSEMDKAASEVADDDELEEPIPTKKMKKEKSEKPVKSAKKSAMNKHNSEPVEPATPAKKKKKNARKENIRVSRDETVRSEHETEPETTVTPAKSNKSKKSKNVEATEVAAKGTAKHGPSNTKKDSVVKKSKLNKKRQPSPVPDEIEASGAESDQEIAVKPKAAKERKFEKQAKTKKPKETATAVDVPEKKSKLTEKKKSKAKQKAAAVKSRSPSVASTASSASLPAAKFTVDLHEKYSKSASHRKLDDDVDDDDDDDDGVDAPHPRTSKSSYKKPNELSPTEKVVARNRSPSPTVSQYSSEFSSRSGTPNTKIKDKFDLIKERRSRSNATVSSNNDDNKWNQIVKNAAKIKDKTKNDGKVQEKNQKLKETIEKLKQKNKQSKKLLNKLFDAKASANEDGATSRDGVDADGATVAAASAAGKSAFDLLRTDSAGASSATKKSPEKGKTKTKATPVADADAGASKKSSKKQKDKVNPATKLAKKSAKLLAKATSAGATTNKKAAASNNNNNNNNKANMEALELETEQTLKDINRWLEHTPRFSDFNSASNSPTRFNNLLDDFDTVTAKLDPADFGRPVPPLPAGSASVGASDSKADASTKTTAKTGTDDAKEPTVKAAPKQTIQLTGIPPAPGPHKRDKEPKKKSLKEKISALVPKHVHRTIERLQPGKTKGNLLGTIHSSAAIGNGSSATKANEDSVASGSGTTLSVNKSKEVKNSLVQTAKDAGPQLSLGSVLNTAGFGLGQQHNFSDNENTKGKHSPRLPYKVQVEFHFFSFSFRIDVDQLCENSKDACSDDMELEEIVTSTELLTKEKERKEKAEQDKLTAEKVDTASASATSAKSQLSPVDKSADKSATPNLNAWLKAFGVPKKQKKQDEEEAAAAAATASSKKEDKSPTDSSASASATSPLVTNVVEQSFASPAPRTTRKASTGSTISERSSFSQDPDSPRIGIDERCGSYPAPYPSPLGASPIMTSPKDDIVPTKPTSPFPMNGAIRVGFYQDTTTKSSPEKSCSPREQPSASPYSNYAQHLYVSTTTASASSTAYSNLSYTSAAKTTTQLPTASLGFNNKNKTPSYFDQYKQPKSQDSDYNSSIGSNPNSPYQSSQQSPYQAEHSPYHQPQTSPYTQPAAAPAIVSPVVQQQQPLPQPQPQQQPPVSPYQNQQPQSQPQPQPQPQPQAQPQQPVSPYQQQHEDVLMSTPKATKCFDVDPQTPVQQAPPSSTLPPHPSCISRNNHGPITEQFSNDLGTICDRFGNDFSANAAQQQQANLHSYMGYGTSSYANNHHHSHYGHNLMDTTSGMSPMLMPTMANKMTPVPGKHDSIPSADGQSELLNLDCSKHSSMNASNRVTTATASKMQDLNTKQAHSGAAAGYDYNMFVDPFNKNMAYNNMSTSKALEMFNRAATMSFSKSFPNPLTSSTSSAAAAGKSDASADLNNAQMWNPSAAPTVSYSLLTIQNEHS